jgi:outer membrane immunogenic protein
MHKMKQRLLGGVASAALLNASAALAAPPVLPSWTGFYIGGHAGYSWGSIDGDLTHTVLVPQTPFFVRTPNPVIIPSLGRDLDPNGGLGGFQAGYNYQVDRIVYGLEADLSWTGQRDTSNFGVQHLTLNFEDFDYRETLAAKLQYMGTVRGRIGYAFDQFLPYVTGGFAWGRMKMDLSWAAAQRGNPGAPVFASASFSSSEAHTLTGWTLGAGFEYAFAPRWTAKFEYLYVDLGKDTYFAGIPGGGAFGLTDQIVRFGINFRT